VNALLPGVRTALVRAVVAVNASFARLPEAKRPELTDWDKLDAEVDAACASGDRARALRAIETWRDHWLAKFEEARS